jgi:hypothetical protein
MKLNEKIRMKAKREKTIKRTKDHISPASKSSSAIFPLYKTWNFWPEPLKAFRTPCSLELISHGTVFFSHNKSANSTFRHGLSAKRTGRHALSILSGHWIYLLTIIDSPLLIPPSTIASCYKTYHPCRSIQYST